MYSLFVASYMPPMGSSARPLFEADVSLPAAADYLAGFHGEVSAMLSVPATSTGAL